MQPVVSPCPKFAVRMYANTQRHPYTHSQCDTARCESRCGRRSTHIRVYMLLEPIRARAQEALFYRFVQILKRQRAVGAAPHIFPSHARLKSIVPLPVA